MMCRKVPNKNRHRRYHYVRKNGKWKPKLKFETRQAAEGFIAERRLEGYAAYVCPYCHKYHIGHSGCGGGTK